MAVYRFNPRPKSRHPGRSMKKKEFSAFVKRTRKAHGISRIEMSQLIDCSPVTIWRWENTLSLPDDRLLNYWVMKIKSTLPLPSRS